jgi:hypothetical protein
LLDRFRDARHELTVAEGANRLAPSSQAQTDVVAAQGKLRAVQERVLTQIKKAREAEGKYQEELASHAPSDSAEKADYLKGLKFIHSSAMAPLDEAEEAVLDANRYLPKKL